jgi:hypothetical protein
MACRTDWKSPLSRAASICCRIDSCDAFAIASILVI